MILGSASYAEHEATLAELIALALGATVGIGTQPDEPCSRMRSAVERAALRGLMRELWPLELENAVRQGNTAESLLLLGHTVAP